MHVAKTKKAATKNEVGNSGQLKFSQDIAPILVANCIGCHSGEGVGLRKGKLDLTTFEKLKKGSQKRADDPEIVIAGKPAESHLVLRIKGEETPRMPQGGNNRMSDEAIAKIEQWVKEGAKLDAGIDPKKPIKSYAASPEQVARTRSPGCRPQERDKKVEAVGLERWKQANPKLKPEIVPGEHFVMFSNLPRDRATSTLKVMETQYGHLKRLLGSPSTDWVEKVSLYVFSSRKDFIEFVRTVESREVEADSSRVGEAVDPATLPGGRRSRGGQERGTGGRQAAGRGRDEARKRTRTAAARIGRLAGILTEALGAGAVVASGNRPALAGAGDRLLPGRPGRAAEPLLPAIASNRIRQFRSGLEDQGERGPGRRRSDHRRRPSLPLASHWWKR